jgi:hypothetical protein
MLLIQRRYILSHCRMISGLARMCKQHRRPAYGLSFRPLRSVTEDSHEKRESRQSWGQHLNQEHSVHKAGGTTSVQQYTGWSKSLCAPDDYSTFLYSNNPHTIDDLKLAITEYIRNVDRAILNTVFENTVRRVNKCLETGGGLWTLLVTFCIVIIRCTETFWSLRISMLY